VANFISDNITRYQAANLQLALIYGWLHDIGKADEYRPCKTDGREFKLTPSAYLHGHQLNGLHLVIKAQARHVPIYPEKTFDHLRHFQQLKLCMMQRIIPSNPSRDLVIKFDCCS
jgi:hypothetical protein